MRPENTSKSELFPRTQTFSDPSKHTTMPRPDGRIRQNLNFH
jgi:hypothetical protein